LFASNYLFEAIESNSSALVEDLKYFKICINQLKQHQIIFKGKREYLLW
jgi:hypothetical protein